LYRLTATQLPLQIMGQLSELEQARKLPTD